MSETFYYPATSTVVATTVTATTFSGSGASLTSLPMGQASGTLAIANGGTGLTSFTSGGLLYASSTSVLASSAPYIAGQVLYGSGPGAAPVSSSGLFWDSGNSRLGIGKTNPGTALDVNGTVTASTFYGALAGSNTGTFSNIYSANALTTTNLFANTLTLSNASATITGNLYVSNAITTTNANILSIQTSNLIPATQGLFMNLQSNFTLTGNWNGNIASTTITTSNLYTLFNSTGGQTWNAYGQSAGPIIRGPTANGGFTFAQPGPYSMTCSIASASGVKTLAISSNTSDIHSNVTNVWSYCFRYSFGEIPSIPVTLPFYVSSTTAYYYLDIETNVQGDTVYQTAYSNAAANAYTGSYVIIRPI